MGAGMAIEGTSEIIRLAMTVPRFTESVSTTSEGLILELGNRELPFSGRLDMLGRRGY